VLRRFLRLLKYVGVYLLVSTGVGVAAEPLFSYTSDVPVYLGVLAGVMAVVWLWRRQRTRAVRSPKPIGAWHADPIGWHEFLYWDGGKWTEDVADNGVTAVDPLLAPPSSEAVVAAELLGSRTASVDDGRASNTPVTRAGLRRERRATKEEHAIAARKAYQAFPGLPGTHAEWRRTEGDRRSLDLVERDGDILASDRRRWITRRITVGEHVFAERREGRRFSFTSRFREVIDLETGAPIFRIEGHHSYRKANMIVHLPDGRRYSFPVQGEYFSVAVMTAVDETGTAVAQFRRVSVPSPRLGKWNTHPKDEVVLLGGDQLVTRELICVIAVARLELFRYVTKPGGGG
jgi:hypothetical protein